MSESECKNECKWELFDVGVGAVTERLKVDGGYLYYVGHRDRQTTNRCFVPDVDLKRYESHLRDAYRQGYVAGHEDCKRGVEEKFEG